MAEPIETTVASFAQGDPALPKLRVLAVDDDPVDRLEWHTHGSPQRRLRGGLNGVRATVWDWDSAELLALEVYLARRSAGLPMQPPGVRP